MYVDMIYVYCRVWGDDYLTYIDIDTWMICASITKRVCIYIATNTTSTNLPLRDGSLTRLFNFR